MQRSRSAVLSVASAGQIWQGTVVQWAVDNLVGGWNGVSEDVGATVAVHICAVISCAAGSG